MLRLETPNILLPAYPPGNGNNIAAVIRTIDKVDLAYFGVNFWLCNPLIS